MLTNAAGDCGGTDPAAIEPVSHPAAVTAVPGICHGNVGEHDAVPRRGLSLGVLTVAPLLALSPLGAQNLHQTAQLPEEMERQRSAEGSWGLKVQLRREPDREETRALMIAGCSAVALPMPSKIQRFMLPITLLPGAEQPWILQN